MVNKNSKILLVDDEDLVLDALETSFTKEGFNNLIFAEDGIDAITKVHSNPDIELILLDWMMPKMDGIEVLKKIKKDPKLKYIPVIMQSAKGSWESINQGLDAGCLHYLTKPYKHGELIAHVYSAMDKYSQKKELMKQNRLFRKFREQIEYATENLDIYHSHFRKPKRAMVIAQFASLCFKKPTEVMTGILELCMNAIEHGNLGISFDEKSQLLGQDKFHEEMNERFKYDEYKNKRVQINLHKDEEKTEVRITDEGQGFEPSDYLDKNPGDYEKPNGRGLMMANNIFDELLFENDGRTVIARQYT